MRHKLNPPTLIRSSIPWLILFAIPLLLNGFIWQTLVLPQKKDLAAWQEVQSLVALKPQLRTLLTESRRLRVERAKAGFTQKDSQSAMQFLQQSAARNGVTVKETRMKGQAIQVQTTPQESQATVPVELDATGSFNKLARWMSEMESQPGFQIDSWSVKLASSTVSSSKELCQLTVKVTIFVGGA